MSNPYEGLPASAYWRSGVSEVSVLSPVDLYVKKWNLAPEDKIAAAGSCFAQHVSRQLQQRKFNVLDMEPPPPRLGQNAQSSFGYGMYSARYGNLYTVKQLLQLAQEAFGDRDPGPIVWQRGGRFYDALRPAVEPEGLDSAAEVMIHRKYHLQQVRKMFLEMDVFIFTLGLTETWEHSGSDTVFPTAPGVIADTDEQAAISFKNFTHAEILHDMKSFIQYMEQHRGRSCKYLFTVSPVPLTATATGQHVLAASTYSKSVLRGVAGELFETYDNVDYFPSYELVSSSWSRGIFFNQNLRTVASAGVDLVMKVFFQQHENPTPAKIVTRKKHDLKSSMSSTERANMAAGDTEPQCEEAILEAFSR